MKPEYDLVSFHIIEKFNNTTIITWTYPSISDALKQKLQQICLQDKQKTTEFMYHRLDKQWINIWERFKEQKNYALVLVTKSLNSVKYQHFGTHLCNIYESKYKPIELVQVFLGAFTNGSYKVQQNGTQCNVYFNEGKVFQDENFEDLVNAFDVEIILIFNALLLKKRIFVYHNDYSSLLKQLEVISRLIDIKLRDPNEYLFPLVKNASVELKGKSFFLAGITDKNINIKPDAYDLFINLQNSSIKISPNSKDIFQMTKWHKEIATLLTTATETALTHPKSSELYKKTLDLLTNLRSFAVTSASDDNPSMVTIDALRAKKLPPAMENFLFNLAIAENIMML